jgi:sugar lactone lactonase YvrE
MNHPPTSRFMPARSSAWLLPAGALASIAVLFELLIARGTDPGGGRRRPVVARAARPGAPAIPGRDFDRQGPQTLEELPRVAGRGALRRGRRQGHDEPDGRVYGRRSKVFVADSNGQTVHVFDLESRRYGRWEPPEKFGLPVALAWDGAGSRLLVSDSVAACVYAFDASGAMTARLGAGALKRPAGIAPDAGGRVYVADVAAHQVILLDGAGAEITRLGERGTELGTFNYPTNLALDRQGRLYVSDTLNFRVQVFGADLKPIRQIGRQGDLPGYFAQPKGVAVDPDGHVYVVDAQFEAVQLFSPEGQLLLSVGREGRGPGEFWLPAGIHIDAKGRVWIADSYNQRVQVFQYLGDGTDGGTDGRAGASTGANMDGSEGGRP